MKILICSKLFYPSNRIGAVRPSNFAKYLAILGHEIIVISDKKEIEKEFTLPDVKIIRISNSPWIKKIIVKINKRVVFNDGKTQKLSKKPLPSSNKFLLFTLKAKTILRQHFSELFSLIIDLDWFYNAKKFTKKKYKYQSFDVVLSTYGPLPSFLLGKFIKKSGIGSIWISDFRDHMRFEGYTPWMNNLMIGFEKNALKNADALIFVSKDQRTMFSDNWHVTDHQKHKIHTIYNGYEKKMASTSKEKPKNKVLKFLYTGQLYGGIRDFTLLFHVVDDLINDSIIDKNKIKIQYAGHDSDKLNKQISKFKNIKDICTDFGFIEREEAIKLQEECDILIALTWNTMAAQGNLTGKFLEYLQAQKPVISLTSGDLPNGELTRLVRSLNLGIACEYYNYEMDYLKLKKYITNQYHLIQVGNHLDFKPKNELIEKFHYANISNQLMDIVDSITRKI